MKRGKMSQMEVMAMKQCIYEGKTIEETAALLDRSVSIVTKAANKYDLLLEDIIKAKLEDIDIEEEKPDGRNRYSSDDVIFKEENFDDRYQGVVNETLFLVVLKKLRAQGLGKVDSSKIMNKVLAKARKAEVKFDNENALYGACIKQMRSADFIVKQTEGGNSGVAVMTQTASNKRDDSLKNSRSVTGAKHIFQPFGDDQ